MAGEAHRQESGLLPDLVTRSGADGDARAQPGPLPVEAHGVGTTPRQDHATAAKERGPSGAPAR